MNVSTRHGLWLVLLAVAAVLAGCATAAGQESPQVRRLHAQAEYERALSFLQENKPAPAVAALRSAIAIDPTVAGYHDLLGLVYLNLRQPEMALESLKRATEVDPSWGDGHFHLGTAFAELRRWDEAVAQYKKAATLPTLSVPDQLQQNLGVALYNLKRYAEAEEALRFAIGLDPEMQAAYYNLGLVLLAQHRNEDAKKAFRQARHLGADSPFGRAATERLKALGDQG